ncbi:MAG: hypothetical protein ACRC1M_05805 [Methanobacteriaceae archaeon]
MNFNNKTIIIGIVGIAGIIGLYMNIPDIPALCLGGLLGYLTKDIQAENKEDEA